MDLSLPWFFAIITLSLTLGAIIGAYYTLKTYRNNKYFSVLPGQIWLLHGVGLVRVVHSGQPGSEILYLYNIDKGDMHVESGVCSREELMKNGMLLIEQDEDINYSLAKEEEEEFEGENIIKFPHTIEYEDDWD